MKMTKKVHAIVIVVLLAIIAICSYVYNTTSYLREIKSYPVTLTEAYSSTLNVGKSNTKEVFRGRFFHAESNLLLDRSLDGFQYQRFLDGGKKPLPVTLNLSRIDLGEKEPKYAINCLIFAVNSGIFLILYGLMAFLGVFNDYDSYKYSYR
jgi:hypothetical protein